MLGRPFNRCLRYSNPFNLFLPTRTWIHPQTQKLPIFIKTIVLCIVVEFVDVRVDLLSSGATYICMCVCVGNTMYFIFILRTYYNVNCKHLSGLPEEKDSLPPVVALPLNRIRSTLITQLLFKFGWPFSTIPGTAVMQPA